MIYVANWPAVRNNVWITLLKARAMENLSYFIGVNRTDKNIKKQVLNLLFYIM